MIFVCDLNNCLRQSNNKQTFQIITLSCYIDHLSVFLLSFFFFTENIFNDTVLTELRADSKRIGHRSGNFRRQRAASPNESLWVVMNSLFIIAGVCSSQISTNGSSHLQRGGEAGLSMTRSIVSLQYIKMSFLFKMLFPVVHFKTPRFSLLYLQIPSPSLCR